METLSRNHYKSPAPICRYCSILWGLIAIIVILSVMYSPPTATWYWHITGFNLVDTIIQGKGESAIGVGILLDAIILCLWIGALYTTFLCIKNFKK